MGAQNYMRDQLVLNFHLKKYYEQDFYVSSNNFQLLN